MIRLTLPLWIACAVCSRRACTRHGMSPKLSAMPSVRSPWPVSQVVLFMHFCSICCCAGVMSDAAVLSALSRIGDGLSTWSVKNACLRSFERSSALTSVLALELWEDELELDDGALLLSDLSSDPQADTAPASAKATRRRTRTVGNRER